MHALGNQRRMALLLFAASCTNSEPPPPLPTLQTLENMQLEELRLFFLHSSVPLAAADALFIRLMENVRLRRDVVPSLRVLVNMVDSLEDPGALVDQFQINVLMTEALGHPHLVFRLIRRLFDQIESPGLDVQELVADLFLNFFATQGSGNMAKFGCSSAQAREITKNATKVLGRCLNGCAYHDAERLARFLNKFRSHTLLRSRVEAFVGRDPELAREVASVRARLQ